MSLPPSLRYLDPLIDLMVEAVIEDLRAEQGGPFLEEGRSGKGSLSDPPDPTNAKAARAGTLTA